MTAAPVNPEKVLRELRELWSDLAKGQETAGGVLRACAMTLIVATESGPDCEAVRKIVGVLMHDHPSRAVVLSATEGAELSARVFAECWMPAGRTQQICAEGIEMTADAANLGDVAQLLVPLVAPDLPVVLWCRGGRFFSSRYFDPLFTLADRIVVDSAAASNARGAIAVLKEIRSRGSRIADLAWTRLTGWREALAHIFESGAANSAAIRDVEIQYGPPLSTAVLYFSRWIGRALPAARIALAETAAPSGLQAVRLSGTGIELTVMAAGNSLEVRCNGTLSRSLLPSLEEHELMREELTILGSDSVFESLL